MFVAVAFIATSWVFLRFQMVILRLLFQVALGVLGVLPAFSYAAQQSLEARGGRPPWEARRLPDPHSAKPPEGSEKGAASAPIASARVSQGGEEDAGPPPTSGVSQEEISVVRLDPLQLEEDLVSPGAFPLRTETPRKDIQSEASSLPSTEPMQSLDMPDFYEGSGPTDSGAAVDDAFISHEETENRDDKALDILRALGKGVPVEEQVDSFSAALRALPGLAELFLQGSGSGKGPENPRQKRVVEVKGGRMTSSALTMCGRRDKDEDALVVDAQPPETPYTVKALFDGHGGGFSSEFCAENIHSFLKGIKKATPSALTDAFLSLDDAILSGHRFQQSGSTGIVALIEELKEPTELIVAGREVLASSTAQTLHQKLDAEDRVGSAGGPPRLIRLGGPESPAFLVTIANVGDSRATLFHMDGGFSVLSRDHKPTNMEEMKRIEKAGGFVSHFPASVPRVDGILALSRAFGDGFLKNNKSLGPTEQRVVAVPEVHTFYALPGDVLMLACDGVYEPEAMDWVFVSHFMLTLLYEMKNDLTEAAVKLMEYAYESFSGDNISVLLTRFEKDENKTRKARRFQVTPEGHIVAEGLTEHLMIRSDNDDDDDLEKQKGLLQETGESPITL